MANLKHLVSLIITLIVLGVFAVIGYVVYMVVMDVQAKTKAKMEKKNISMHRDGMKVGVKQVSAEQVSDSTQNVLYKVWNAAGAPPAAASSEKRKPFSRHSSGQPPAKKV